MTKSKHDPVGEPLQLARYQSHKIVHAMKIDAVTRNPEYGMGHEAATASNLYHFHGKDAQGEGVAIGISLEIITRMIRSVTRAATWAGDEKGIYTDPLLGGYYVRYADGYESWSPGAIFEQGNDRLMPDPPDDKCALCTTKCDVVLVRDHWEVAGVGELSAIVPLLSCPNPHCKSEVTDWRAEEIRDLVTKHALGLKPDRGRSDKVLVSRKALVEVLNALQGPSHLIRELQAIIPLFQKGVVKEADQISTLIHEVEGQ